MKIWYGVYAYIGDIKCCAFEGPDWNAAATIRDQLKSECVDRVVVETWTKTLTSDETRVLLEQDWDYNPTKT